MPVKRVPVPPRGARPSKGPVYLSAVVYPGVGQMVQRRWVAGVFYAGLFSLCLLAFLICAGVVIVSYYMIGLSFESYQERVLPVRPMVVLFVVTLIVYLMNLYDTHRAFRRAAAAASHAAALAITRPS